MKRFKLKTFTLAALLLISSSATWATDFVVQPGDYLRISIEKKNAQFAKFGYFWKGQAKEEEIHYYQPYEEEKTQITLYSEKTYNDVNMQNELQDSQFSFHRQGDILTLNLKSPITDFNPGDTSVVTILDYKNPVLSKKPNVDVPSQVQFLLKNSKIHLIRNQQPLAESVMDRTIQLKATVGKFPVVFVLRENDLEILQPSNGGEDTGGDDISDGDNGNTGGDTGGDTGDENDGGTTADGENTGGETTGGENTGGNPDENNPPPSGGCSLVTQAVGSSAMLTAALVSLSGLFWMRRRAK